MVTYFLWNEAYLHEIENRFNNWFILYLNNYINSYKDNLKISIIKKVNVHNNFRHLLKVYLKPYSLSC